LTCSRAGKKTKIRKMTPKCKEPKENIQIPAREGILVPGAKGGGEIELSD